MVYNGLNYYFQRGEKMKNKAHDSRPILLVLCFAAFLLYALYFNGFGTNAAAIMSFFNIDEAQNGLILTIQAIGGIAVAVVLGLFGERINKISGLVFGLFAMGVAGILIGLIPGMAGAGSGYILMLSFSLIAGVGCIVIDLLMNSVVADVFPENKNTLLTYVHAFYGAGAMLAPLFVTALVNPENSSSFSLPYMTIGIASTLCCVLLFFVSRKVTPATPYADMREIRSRAKSNPAEVFRDARAWLYLFACFFFMSFQMGISTWLPSYCTNQLGYDFESAGLMVTLYFAGALAIRFLSPVIYKKISVRNFYIFSIILSVGVFLVFLLVPLPPAAAKAVIVLTGMLQGCSVPALVILCCEAFPERTASASSVIIFGISFATLIAPAVMGQLIRSYGNVLPMLVITVCVLFSVAALAPIERMGKRADI